MNEWIWWISDFRWIFCFRVWIWARMSKCIFSLKSSGFSRKGLPNDALWMKKLPKWWISLREGRRSDASCVEKSPKWRMLDGKGANMRHLGTEKSPKGHIWAEKVAKMIHLGRNSCQHRCCCLRLRVQKVGFWRQNAPGWLAKMWSPQRQEAFFQKKSENDCKCWKKGHKSGSWRMLCVCWGLWWGDKVAKMTHVGWESC